MSASTTESSEMHDYLVTGETLFITGATLAFVSDVILTFRSLVSGSWLGLAVGLVCCVGTLFVVNWLYTGKKEARSTAAIWAAVQIGIAVVGTFLVMNLAFRWDYRFYGVGRWLPESLSVPPIFEGNAVTAASYLFGAFKAIAYAFFLYQFVQRGPALFFLRHRGGEALEAPSPTTPPEDVHPTGTVLPLAAEQTDGMDAFARKLQSAGCALMIAGCFMAIVGGQRLAADKLTGWTDLGAGVALVVMGLLAFGPIASLRNLKDRGTDTAYVTDALVKLSAMLGKQTLAALLLLGVTAAAIVIVWMGRS